MNKKKIKLAPLPPSEVIEKIAENSVRQGVASFWAREKEKKHPPEIGDIMSDGTVFAGIHPNTGYKVFAMPQDLSARLDFNEAAQAAANAADHNYTNWRVPTMDELSLLFQNMDKGALKNSFAAAVDSFSPAYWSSISYTDEYGECVSFQDGRLQYTYLETHMAVRLVRTAENFPA